MNEYPRRDKYQPVTRVDAIVKAITSCTHPDATNGAHAYRDGVCRCGAPKRNADGSVPTANPAGEYPRRDRYQPVAYWTGPVGARGTHVTGWKRREGSRTSYFQVTCTCTPYRGVGEQVSGHAFGDVADDLERIAYEHAASHVLASVSA